MSVGNAVRNIHVAANSANIGCVGHLCSFAYCSTNCSNDNNNSEVCSPVSASCNSVSIHIDSINDSHIISPESHEQAEFECFVFTLHTRDSSHMWHMHLGHPSTNILVSVLTIA